MSKETEARVRNELLQTLYTTMLRCTLATAGAGDRAEEFTAVAAGVAANLQPKDLVLLPGRGGAAFRVLRGLPAHAAAGHQAAARAAGVLTLPRNEAQGVALALGAASASAHAGEGALVCVLLPGTIGEADAIAKNKLPATWAGAVVYAARAALPILFVSTRSTASARESHLRPAPLYPTIPVDREDALAVYRVAFECASRARIALGPSLIRCTPFAGPAEGAAGMDALGRVEAMLRQRGAFQKAWRRQLERQLIRELAGELPG